MFAQRPDAGCVWFFSEVSLAYSWFEDTHTPNPNSSVFTEWVRRRLLQLTASDQTGLQRPPGVFVQGTSGSRFHMRCISPP